MATPNTTSTTGAHTVADITLADKDAVATVPVKDLAKARKFYEQTLGLTPATVAEKDVAVYKTGKSSLLVYQSQYAGTNQATAVTWGVGNQLDAIVRALSLKGVTFEHYDLPNTRREGDIHIAGAHHVAWFKDPDGNIINLNNEGA